MKTSERQSVLNQIVKQIEAGLLEAEVQSKEIDLDPRFQLAYEVGYLKGLLKSIAIELTYLD